MVVLPEAPSGEAMITADRLRSLMKEVAHEVELPENLVSASVGVGDLPDCASDADSLILAADTAMLFAKRCGRDRVVYFRDLSGAELKDRRRTRAW